MNEHISEAELEQWAKTRADDAGRLARQMLLSVMHDAVENTKARHPDCRGPFKIEFPEDIAAEPVGWQPIETAPTKGYGFFYSSVLIGAVQWGTEGRVHEHVGPIEWLRDHWEFIGIDYDTFPAPTHWMPLPKPPVTGDTP